MQYHGDAMRSHRRIDWNAAGGRVPEPGRAVVQPKLLSYNSLADITVLRSESREEFEEMRKAMEAEYRPVGLFEIDCLEEMVSAKWRLRRVQKAEASRPAVATKLLSYKRHLKRMFNRSRKAMLGPRTRVQ